MAKAKTKTRSKSDVSATPPAKALPREPTWGKSTVEMKVRGAPPFKATKLHVELLDGAVGSQRQAEEAVSWPSARLRIAFGGPVHWGGQAGSAWHQDAVATALALAGMFDGTWIVHDIIGRNDIPVLKPTPFARAEAQKLAERTLFVEQKANSQAWVTLRTGGPLSVQYDHSLVVFQDSVQLHLPPTSANLEQLEAALDTLAAKVSFAWADVGEGRGGWASIMALTGNSPLGKPPKGLSLTSLVQRDPGRGADRVVWLGDLSQATPAHEALVRTLEKGRTVQRSESRTRVAVPWTFGDTKTAAAAEKLTGDLHELRKKLKAVDARAAGRASRKR